MLDIGEEGGWDAEEMMMKRDMRLFPKVCWRQRNKEVQTMYRRRSCLT